MTTPLSDAELEALLEEAPLFAKMRAIKEFALGFAAAESEDDEVDDDVDDADDDADDAAKKTTIEPVDVQTLNPRQFVVYRFGCIVLDIIRRRCSRPGVTLVAARRLPVSDARLKNPFKKFFLFDGVNRILYFKVDKLENVGEFLLLLIHTLAHVHADDLDESATEFSSNFHKSLSIVLDLLFYLQCQQSQALRRTKGDADSALADLLRGCESSAERQSLIDDLLFEKVDSGRTEEGETHDAALNKRLDKIKAEFKAVAGEELFPPAGREDDVKLEMASAASAGETIFQSVRDFIDNWNDGHSVKDAIQKRDMEKHKETQDEMDEMMAQLIQAKKKSLSL